MINLFELESTSVPPVATGSLQSNGADYIPILDIPSRRHRDKAYPYSEWVKIPDGMALEISHLLPLEQSPASLTGNLRKKLQAIGLKTITRGNRIWIIKDTSKS